MRFWRSSGRPILSPSSRSQLEWLPDLNRLVEAVKHVEAVSAGAKDAGSTPAASTNFGLVAQRIERPFSPSADGGFRETVVQIHPRPTTFPPRKKPSPAITQGCRSESALSWLPEITVIGITARRDTLNLWAHY
jgi:hypothetical protein